MLFKACLISKSAATTCAGKKLNAGCVWFQEAGKSKVGGRMRWQRSSSQVSHPGNQEFSSQQTWADQYFLKTLFFILSFISSFLNYCLEHKKKTCLTLKWSLRTWFYIRLINQPQTIQVRGPAQTQNDLWKSCWESWKKKKRNPWLCHSWHETM